jgi:hypothetical protein
MLTSSCSIMSHVTLILYYRPIHINTTNLLNLTHFGCHRHDIREVRVYCLTLLEQQSTFEYCNEDICHGLIHSGLIKIQSKHDWNSGTLSIRSSSGIGASTFNIIFSIVLTMGLRIQIRLGQLEVWCPLWKVGSQQPKSAYITVTMLPYPTPNNNVRFS